MKIEYTSANNTTPDAVIANSVKAPNTPRQFYSRHVTLLTKNQIKNITGSIRQLRKSNTLIYCEWGQATPPNQLPSPTNVMFVASNYYIDWMGNLTCKLLPVGDQKQFGIEVLNDEDLFKTLKFTPIIRKTGEWEALASVLVTY